MECDDSIMTSERLDHYKSRFNELMQNYDTRESQLQQGLITVDPLDLKRELIYNFTEPILHDFIKEFCSEKIQNQEILHEEISYSTNYFLEYCNLQSLRTPLTNYANGYLIIRYNNWYSDPETLESSRQSCIQTMNHFLSGETRVLMDENVRSYYENHIRSLEQ